MYARDDEHQRRADINHSNVMACKEDTMPGQRPNCGKGTGPNVVDWMDPSSRPIQAVKQAMTWELAMRAKNHAKLPKATPSVNRSGMVFYYV